MGRVRSNQAWKRLRSAISRRAKAGRRCVVLRVDLPDRVTAPTGASTGPAHSAANASVLRVVKAGSPSRPGPQLMADFQISSAHSSRA